jgi:branched-chain amino acid transport system permease protein
MDFLTTTVLVQDGIATGAIYALLGIALVLLFVVTRVIFFPQGDFIAWGALSLAFMQAGSVPPTVWLMLGLAVLATVLDVSSSVREREPHRIPRQLLTNLALPVAVTLLTFFAAPLKLPMVLQVLMVLAIITPMGPLIYRLAYQPLADASVLVLMIVSVGVHFMMTGLGLIFFGVEGYRSEPLWDARLEIGSLTASGQSIVVIAAAVVLIAALWLVFTHTLYGKALRATSSNRVGASLLGISAHLSGKLSFAVATFIGALCGVLIAPLVTLYSDSGLLIGLKGFVAAIIGGLATYPLTAVGAVLIGIVESFATFFASEFKEAIVFLLVIPVLLWLSLSQPHSDEEG